ncbi:MULTISPECIES: PTS sugar transporter subunit IIA [Vagococcus]|uniref:Mannitol-specific phosphotransferase enzyme IIA component n=1 Tax=Vagococcus fluvialis bH819 TaxID=1255619 RepID=A0A1X6WKD7_9ENTE|nr:MULTISPECIES: PTS sugar transporter subunit IIA [Vagococcus]SLM84738.1 PTS system, mannitol-specific IIA component [Vagococcus fluvialis bH819]
MKLSIDNISLNQSFETAEEAINYSGEQLVNLGYVTEDYLEKMQERHQLASVYIGNFVSLPHGSGNSEIVLEEGLFLTQVPDGVDFGNGSQRQIAIIIIAVAVKSENQLDFLQELAFFCSDIENIKKLSDSNDKNEVLKLLNQGLF